MDFPFIFISGEYLIILGALGVILNNISILYILFDENARSKQNSQDGTPRCTASHLGLYFILGPIKRAPGLNEINIHTCACIMFSCTMNSWLF